MAVDELIEAAIIKEADARGLPKGALLGILLETIVDDNLFDAVLGSLKS